MCRILIAACAAGVFCSAASADQHFVHADIVCSKTQNVALVRFTETYDDDQVRYAVLPKSADDGLSSDKGKNRTDCTTRWGAAIRVRSGQDQMFAYGMGGGDPPAFFSLWIDKHKVFSRKEWKPGYGADSDETARRIVGIAIRPNRLSICTNRYFLEDGANPITCRDEALNVDRHPVDKIEYPDNPVAQPAGTIYANAKSPKLELCRQRLARAGNTDLNALQMLDAIDAVNVPLPSDGDGVLSRVPGSFPNMGALQVFIYGDTSHAFDGDLVVAVPGTVPAKDVKAWFKTVDLEAQMKKGSTAQWHLFAAGRERLYPKVSPLYVHFTPQKIDGQLYFFVRPTNEDEEPPAALMLPRADGGFEISCAFHLVKAHY